MKDDSFESHELLRKKKVEQEERPIRGGGLTGGLNLPQLDNIG